MSEAKKIRVAVNVYGVIGKRVADAVVRQRATLARTIDAIRALTGTDGRERVDRQDQCGARRGCGVDVTDAEA